MGGFGVATAHGSLSVDSGALVLPAAWIRVVNLADLWVPQNYRGQDLRVAGVAGARSKRRRRDVAEWTLMFHLSSSILHDGTTPSSPEDCIELNLEHLKDVTEPGDARPAVLTKPSGVVRNGSIHLLVHTEEIGPTWCRGSIDVILPAGDWTTP